MTVFYPATCVFDADVEIAPDTVIEPFVQLLGNTKIGAGCRVRSYSIIRDTEIGAGVVVRPGCVIEGAKIVYLEGYLFDADAARRAFAKAAGLARASGRMLALTLSDGFVVERHREALLGFIETQVDLLFANESEICSLFGTDFETALKQIQPLAKLCAITCSEAASNPSIARR